MSKETEGRRRKDYGRNEHRDSGENWLNRAEKLGEESQNPGELERGRAHVVVSRQMWRWRTQRGAGLTGESSGPPHLEEDRRTEDS